MKIEEMFDRVILRSGQFVLRRSKIEVDTDSFRMLVEDALGEFNKFAPIDKTYTVPMLGLRQITLDENFDSAMNRPPDWVSIVRPMRSISGGYYPIRNRNLVMDSELIEPINAPWDFDEESKVLTVPFNDIYKIVVVYDHIIEEAVDINSPGNIIYSVPSVSPKDREFFQLLQGMFLQAIGRSRRAFTLNDLPIIMDADTVVSEGVEIFEKAIEDMQHIQKIRLSIGE